MIVMHRAVLDTYTQRFVHAARSRGCLLVYDVDDLLFDDSIAAYIQDNPGTRLKLGSVKLCRAAMLQCDFITTSTSYLQERAARFHPRTLSIGNGLGSGFWAAANRAYEARASRPPGSQVVLAYLAGSATHDRDFRMVEPSLARVLEERPDVRLRLVGPLRHSRLLDRFGSRVEHRCFVPYELCPEVLQDVDVNLVPLEATEAFCQSKSPLKFIEAAACAVPTVATPTSPHLQVIEHWGNGCLPGDADWHRVLLRLIDEPGLRHQIGERARQTVTAGFTPEAMASKWHALYRELARESSDIMQSRTRSGSRWLTSWQLESARLDRDIRSRAFKARRFLRSLAADRKSRTQR